MERIDLQRFMLRMCCSALYHSPSDVFVLLLHPVTSRRDCSQCSLFKMGLRLPNNCIFPLCTTCGFVFVLASCFSPGLCFSPNFPSFQKKTCTLFLLPQKVDLSPFSLFASRTTKQIRAKIPTCLHCSFLT